MNSKAEHYTEMPRLSKNNKKTLLGPLMWVKCRVYKKDIKPLARPITLRQQYKWS